MSIYKQHDQVLHQVSENAATMLDTRNMQISFYTKNITNQILQTSVEIQGQVMKCKNIRFAQNVNFVNKGQRTLVQKCTTTGSLSILIFIN